MFGDAAGLDQHHGRVFPYGSGKFRFTCPYGVIPI